MRYTVLTPTCMYLLDAGGRCDHVLAVHDGDVPRDARLCVGAQFVASLDLRGAGELCGELRIGATALFLRRDEGRLALLRTRPIVRVDVEGEAPPAYATPPPEPVRAGPVRLATPLYRPSYRVVAPRTAAAPLPPPTPLPPPPSGRSGR